MTSSDQLNVFAASRGEGLHPTPRDVFEHATASPLSDVASRHAGMLEAGPRPELEMVASRGTVASSPHELASRHGRQSRDAAVSETDTVEYAAPAETARTMRSTRSHRVFFPSANHIRGFPARLRSNPPTHYPISCRVGIDLPSYPLGNSVHPSAARPSGTRSVHDRGSNDTGSDRICFGSPSIHGLVPQRNRT